MLECNVILTPFCTFLHAYIHFICLMQIQNTEIGYLIPQISLKIPRYEFLLMLPSPTSWGLNEGLALRGQRFANEQILRRPCAGSPLGALRLALSKGPPQSKVIAHWVRNFRVRFSVFSCSSSFPIKMHATDAKKQKIEPDPNFLMTD